MAVFMSLIEIEYDPGKPVDDQNCKINSKHDLGDQLDNGIDSFPYERNYVIKIGILKNKNDTEI